MLSDMLWRLIRIAGCSRSLKFGWLGRHLCGDQVCKGDRVGLEKLPGCLLHVWRRG